MLDILKKIVQEVNEAEDLPEVFQIIVKSIAKAISVEACSIYLTDKKYNHYLLVASIGFLDGVDGKVAIKFSDGLVGLVGEREEPINVSDAHMHPRYLYFPQTGEEIYKAFLGVPIIHQRKLVGILVVQQRHPRSFDDEEVAFLVTICAHLAGSIIYARSSGFLDNLHNEYNSTTVHGIGAATGVGVGQAKVLYIAEDLLSVRDKPCEDIDQQIKNYLSALEKTKCEIKKLKQNLKRKLMPEEASIFDAYVQIIDSNSIKTPVIDLIKQNHWAPFALRKVFNSHINKFSNMEDPYLKERAKDILDLGQRILVNLQCFDKNNKLSQKYPDQTILVAEDITAPMLAQIPKNKLVAVVAINGSVASHGIILAKAMGIPAVVGAQALSVKNIEGKTVIVDGYTGDIIISPRPSTLREFSRLAREETELSKGLLELKDLRSETLDGIRIPLCVNIGLIGDLNPALQAGASGVGLYRTEVPFMMRDSFPQEQEQFLIYNELLKKFSPNNVVMRTLDIGGDKNLTYFPVTEKNPFLGWRGIRVTLDHPEIFLVQLRAMLRASENLDNLSILLPMISSIREINEAKSLIKQAFDELIEEGFNIKFPKIGVMIEVPATIFQAQIIASEVDFLSVGSNDLTQYLLAVDRTNPQVSIMYDSFHPALLLALKKIVDAAKSCNKPVSICGEMAALPSAVVFLIGIGFDMLSVNAHSIPKIKWVIRNFKKEDAVKIASHALNLQHASEVKNYLDSMLEQAGLGGLVRAGK